MFTLLALTFLWIVFLKQDAEQQRLDKHHSEREQARQDGTATKDVGAGAFGGKMRTERKVRDFSS